MSKLVSIRTYTAAYRLRFQCTCGISWNFPTFQVSDSYCPGCGTLCKHIEKTRVAGHMSSGSLQVEE